MGESKPVEWCLDANPSFCLPSGEWAAWMQAGLSVAALIIALTAIVVPLWAARRSQTAGAKVVASGILVGLNQCIGAMQSVTAALKERLNGDTSEGSSPRTIIAIIDMLRLPSQDELMILSGALPDCAIELLRSKNATLQIRSALDILANQVGWRDDAQMRELLSPLALLADQAATAFESARGRLDAYCPA